MSTQTRSSLSPTTPPSCLRVRDVVQLGAGFDAADDRLDLDTSLMRGRRFDHRLRDGLFIHGSDVIEERPFTVHSQMETGLSCVFFLQGNIEVKIGDRPFSFRTGQGEAISSTVISSTRPESFQRASPCRQALRHLVLSIPFEWLAEQAPEVMAHPKQGLRQLDEHLKGHLWTPPSRVCQLVSEMFEPSAQNSVLERLLLEGRAITLVAETLAAILHDTPVEQRSSPLTQPEALRLQRAKQWIEAQLVEQLDVDSIARHAGASASTLQRLFRQAEGLSVFDYVRQQRLQRAHASLRSGQCSVQHASDLAGYSSAANFATAFKRQFGISPKALQTQQRSG